MNTDESAKTLLEPRLSLNEDFWAELDSVSETGADVSQSYSEPDEEGSPDKSLEGESQTLFL